jgi:hypothetical protein
MTQPKVTSSKDRSSEYHTAAASTEQHQGSAAQNIPLATTFDELLGEDEATDETADDIIRTVRAWRDVTSSRSLDE